MGFAPIFILVGLIMLTGCARSARFNHLKPFTTDSCSMWPEGTKAKPNLWHNCCVAHDRDYWIGGSEEQRRASDEKLRACVKEVAGESVADEMYSGVRLGGSPYWLTHYRWGYGWNYFDGLKPRGNKIPTAEEQQQIDALIPAAEKVIAEDAAKQLPESRQQNPSSDNSSSNNPSSNRY